MTVKLTIELPEALERKARAEGLLQPERVAKLIEREVEQEQARQDFFEMIEEVRAQPGAPMTMDEIQAIVNEVRTERAAREAGH